MVETNGIYWHSQHERSHPDQLGFIPDFLSAYDSKPAIEQFAENYCGGWMDFKGFTYDEQTGALKYPEDPDTALLYAAHLPNGEVVRIYQHAWVAVFQPDGSFRVARLD